LYQLILSDLTAKPVFGNDDWVADGRYASPA